MNTLHDRLNARRAGARRRPPVAWLLALAMLLSLAACAEDTKVTTQDQCDDQLDTGNWDLAIEICSQIETDEGYSKTAQAYMGRAGVSLLELIRKIDETDATGLALVLTAFTVTGSGVSDVDSAIDYLLMISEAGRTETDYFNMLIASDVAIATLIEDELNITVQSGTGEMTIPGITDSGLEDLDASSTAEEIQAVLIAIYGDPTQDDTYYATPPPEWDNPAADIDLSTVSTYVQANQAGAGGLELGELSDLDFASQIDNGKCALAGSNTASGVNPLNEGKKAVRQFPRRLNTSDPTWEALADELQFVLGPTGSIDSSREWAGEFKLASRLLNPDHIGMNVAASGLLLDNFEPFMDGTTLTEQADLTAVSESDLATAINCNTACDNWPLLSISTPPNSVDDEYGAQGDEAKRDLAAALHQLYPIDNTDGTPETSGLHCVSGDGWVHAREYDFYLRSLGAE